jgi:steroid 5-alpha reductase family enzyme
MRTRVHAIMDTIWPLGFVLIAVVSFLLSAGSGVVGRRVLVLVLTAVWGLRLGAHIYTRNRGQGRVMWFVSVPVQAAMYEHAPLGLVSWLGAAVWAVGFGFEASGTRSCAESGPIRPTPGGCSRSTWRGPRGRRTPSTFGAPMASSPARRAERMGWWPANRI